MNRYTMSTATAVLCALFASSIAPAQADLEPPRIISVSPVPAFGVRDQHGLASLVIEFSEPVIVSTPPTIWGVLSGSIDFTTDYEVATTELNLVFAPAVRSDRVTVVVGEGIRDLAGNALDGEIMDPRLAVLPSGDGIAGGLACFRFDVISGDANRDGSTNQADALVLLEGLGRCWSDEMFNPDADLDSDGCVNVNDIAIFYSGVGESLPVLDGARPTIRGFERSNGAPLTADLETMRIVFSEELDPRSVVPGVAVLRSLGGTQFFPSKTTLLADGMTIECRFSPPISSCGNYAAHVSNALCDLSGELLEPLVQTPGFSGSTPPPSPVLEAFPPLTAAAGVTLTGTIPAKSGFAQAVAVRVQGPDQVVTVAANGTFSVTMPLEPNEINYLYVSAISPCGIASAPVVAEVSRDITPPNLTVQFPPDGAETFDTAVNVGGTIGDSISGFQGLSVSVNGRQAAVDIGIGQNGTWVVQKVALNKVGEPTVLTITASDVLGNTVTATRTVTRTAPPKDAATIQVLEGDDQVGSIRAQLPVPIAVRVLRGDGAPFANKPVTFRITQEDGVLRGPGVAVDSLTYQTVTDSMGVATASWRLGSTAGCGNNRVEATAVGVSGTARFSATALPLEATQLNIGSGNDQRIETGGTAPLRLSAWVSDGGNPVIGVPVTFTVTAGGGLVDGLSTVTVASNATGHAEVSFSAGSDAGVNVVEADFVGNASAPVIFTTYGIARDYSKPTSFRGLVLDNSSRPIGRVKLMLKFGTTVAGPVLTNDDGQFEFAALGGDGAVHVIVEGFTANRLGGLPIPAGMTFPSLGFDTVIVPNAENSLGKPILLPPLSAENTILWNGQSDVTLECAGIAGLRFKVKAGSMTLQNGSHPTPGAPVKLSLNQVHHDDVPMPMPNGVAPPFAWTFQPASATFDPPVEIEYPNMSALPAGGTAYFLTFNHDLGEFEVMAPGRVSADGSLVVTAEGTGLRRSGWGCNCPPYAVSASVCCPEAPGSGEIGITFNGKRPADFTDFILDSASADGSSDPIRVRITSCDGADVSWSVTPLGDGTPEVELPAGSGKEFTISHTATAWRARREPLTTPSAVGNQPIGYQVTVSVAGAPPQTFEVRQDQQSIIRQEYADFRRFKGMSLPIPARSRITGVPTCDGFEPGELNPRVSDCPCGSSEAAPYAMVVNGCLDEVACNTRAAFVAAQGEGATGIAGVHIESANRTPRRNLCCGGVPNSDHQHGNAVDMAPASGSAASRAKLMALLYHTARSAPSSLGAPEVLLEKRTRQILPENWLPPRAVGPVAIVRLSAPNGGWIDVADTDGDALPDVVSAVSSTAVARDGFPVPSAAGGLQTHHVRFYLGESHRGDVTVGDLPRFRNMDTGLWTSLASCFNHASHVHAALTSPLCSGASGFGESAGEGSGRIAEWTYQVAGRGIISEGDTGFTIPNVIAADQWGADGPGTPPDFKSDDVLRVVGTAVINGQTRYRISEPFQIASGASTSLAQLAETSTPPLLPSRISISAPSFMPVGVSGGVTTTAVLSDGTEVDATTARSGTTYRTSNPTIATVSNDGVVTAHAAGRLFITAINGAATAVCRITIEPSAVATSLVGVALYEDGGVAAGARVTSPFGGVAKADANGVFVLAVTLPLSTSSVNLSASVLREGLTFQGAKLITGIVPGGITEAGELRLAPAAYSISWVGGGSQGRWDDPLNWSDNRVPGPRDDVFIAMTSGSVSLLESAAVQSLHCEADLRLTDATLTVTDAAFISGAVVFNEGGATGGVWTVAQAAEVLSSARLESVTWNGDIALAETGSMLRIRNVTLNGTTTLSGVRSALAFDGTQSFPSGTIAFAYAGGVLADWPRLEMSISGTLTLGASARVEGGNGRIGNAGGSMTLVNHGTIECALAGRSLSIECPWSNTGTIALAEGTLTLSTANQNTGTVSLGAGSLRVTGNVRTADLASLTLGQGVSVSIAGVLDNTGGSWSPSGASALEGGMILGGTVNLPSGLALRVAGNGGRLESVTWNGDIALAEDYSELRIRNVTLNGTATLSGASSALAFEGTQSFPSGTIAFAYAGGVLADWPRLEMSISGTLTLGASARVEGGNGLIGRYDASIGDQPMTLVNHGTIECALAGRSLSIECPWSNTGTIALAEGTLTLGRVIQNTGPVSIGAGTVRFTGNVRTADLASLKIGQFVSVSIAGILDNTGASWSPPGAVVLEGGTIKGGTVTLPSGQALQVFHAFFPGSVNIAKLESVTWNGDIALAETGSMLRIRNVTLNGTATLSGAASRLLFDGTQSFPSGTIAFEYAGGVLADWPRLEMSISGTLTLGASARVEGGNGRIGNAGGSMTLVNHGTIECALAGRSLSIECDWSNTGTIALAEGTLTLSTANQNTGTVSLGAGSVRLTGNLTPTIVNALVNSVPLGQGVSVSIAGTVTNTGGSWSPSRAMALDGGTILGGTVNLPSGLALRVSNNSNNRLAGVTWNGDIALAETGSRLRIQNVTLNGTTTLSGAKSALAFDGTQSFPSGTIAFAYAGGVLADWPAMTMSQSGTLTLGASARVEGGNGRIGRYVAFTSDQPMTLVNHGTIECALAGRSLSIECPWSNTGTIALAEGTLTLSTANQNTGTVSLGAGSVRLTGNLTPTFVNALVNSLTLGQGVSVSIAGTVTNTGGSWSPSRAMALDGGTILGGTVNLPSGLALRVSNNSNNRLDSVTWNGDIALAETGSMLRIRNVTLNGTTTLSGASSALAFEGTQSFPSGTIAFAYAGGVLADWPAMTMSQSGTLTLGASARVEGGNGRIGRYVAFTSDQPMTLVNHGTIECALAGRSLSIECPWSNTGTIALAEGTLNFSTATQNTGTVSLGAGSVRLTGNLTPTFVNALGNSMTLGQGVSVSIAGDLNNNGGSWSPSRAMALDGGRIWGGTVNLPSGLALRVSNNSNNQLESVTWNGDIALAETGSKLGIWNVTLNGTTTLSGAKSALAFQGTQSFPSGTIAFAYAGGVLADWPRLEMSINPEFFSSGTLTLGASARVEGGNGRIVTTGGRVTLVNNGTIECALAGRSLSIECDWSNTGTIALAEGTLTLSAATQNTGTVSLGAGSVRLTGNLTPTFVNALVNSVTVGQGVSVSIAGDLDNTGGSWSPSRAMALDGGRIWGGTVNLPSGLALRVSNNGNNRLDSVTWNGDIALAETGSMLSIRNVTLNGTTTLSGASSELAFSGTQSFPSGTIAFAYAGGVLADWPAMTMSQSGTLTLGASARVEGGNGRIGRYVESRDKPMALVNHGTIECALAGRSLAVEPTVEFRCPGLLRVANGGQVSLKRFDDFDRVSGIVRTGQFDVGAGSTIDLPTSRKIAALLRASITLRGAGADVVGSGATLLDAIGNIGENGLLRLEGGRDLTIAPASGSVVNAGVIKLAVGSDLDVVGGFSQTSAGELAVILATPVDIPFVTTGSASLAGLLRIDHAADFELQSGSQLPILEANGLVGSFGAVITPIGDQTADPPPIVYSENAVIYNYATGFRSGHASGVKQPIEWSLASVSEARSAHPLTLEAGMSLEVSRRILRAESIVVRAGARLAISAGAWLKVGLLEVEEGAEFDWTGGGIELLGGTWRHGAPLEIGCVDVATLVLRDGAEVIAPRIDVCPFGLVSGDGRLRAPVRSAGVLAPRGSGIEIAAGFVQHDLGLLEIAWTGSSDRPKHPVAGLTVHGNAALAGSVEFALLDEFTAEPLPLWRRPCGLECTVLRANSVSGVLRPVTDGACGAGFTACAESDRVVLRTARSSLRGDLDHDGLISQSDVAALLELWGGCTAVCCPGDIEPDGGDGVVDGRDLEAVIFGLGREVSP